LGAVRRRLVLDERRTVGVGAIVGLLARKWRIRRLGADVPLQPTAVTPEQPDYGPVRKLGHHKRDDDSVPPARQGR
jgi:hypothetical protein